MEEKQIITIEKDIFLYNIKGCNTWTSEIDVDRKFRNVIRKEDELEACKAIDKSMGSFFVKSTGNLMMISIVNIEKLMQEKAIKIDGQDIVPKKENDKDTTVEEGDDTKVKEED